MLRLIHHDFGRLPLLRFSLCRRVSVVQLVTDDRAVAKDYLPLGVRGEVDVVRDEHKRYSAVPVQVGHQLEDMLAVLRIQIAGRLVGEQDLRLVGERSCDGDPLLFAAGKLGRVMVSAVRQIDVRQKLFCPLASVRAGRVSPSGSEYSRKLSGSGSGETIGKRNRSFGCGYRPAASSLILVISSPSMKISPDDRSVKAGNQPQQRRFAAPRSPGKSDKLSFGDIRRNIR